MSVKPIDLQSNLSQISEVARAQNARSDAIAEQQHVADKESAENSKLKNSKLDENKKASEMKIKDEDKSKDRRQDREKKKNKSSDNDNSALHTKIVDDYRLGRIIDIKK